MKKSAIPFFLFITALFLSQAFAQETLTITTYYPSPSGVYNELRVGRVAIGDNYMQANHCWSPDVCANQIAANTDLVVEGNVGIGTTTASSINSKLHIVADLNTPTFSSSAYFDNNANAENAIIINSGSTTPQQSVLYFNQLNNPTWSIHTTSSKDLTIREYVNGMPGTYRMYFENTGNVGIGTTNPRARLDVNGEVRIGNTGSVSCSPTTAGTIRYNTGVTPNVMEYCNGSIWASFGGANCPTGYVNTGKGFCIEVNQRAASSWNSAVGTCAANGAQLCSYTEWRYACANSLGNNMTNDWEWVADVTDNVEDDEQLGVGSGSCSAVKDTEGSRTFRCCMPSSR
ncbi:MAG: hypothetical protein WC546_05960 [Candidatus Omnitrophota bacterium]